jgi:hypothetical protein
MSEHRARVEWRRYGEFVYESYSRSHAIGFGDGIRIAGTAAPGNIPKTAPHAPGVDRYADDAAGVMKKNAEGRVAMTNVTLAPRASFSGKTPSGEEHARLRHEAHGKCFIANSVKTDVVVSPTIA